MARGGGAVLDQALSSATQFIVVIFIAHAESAASFGAASAVMLVHGLLLGLQRASLGDLALLRCRRPGSDISDTIRAALGAAFGYSVAAGVLLAVAGVAIGGTGGRLLVVVAILSPAIYTQDMLRSLAYGRDRVGWAVGLDGLWLVVQVLGSAALFVAGQATAVSLVAMWGLGAVSSAGFGLARGRYRPSLRAVDRWRDEDGPRARGFSIDYMSQQGILMLANLALGLVLVPADFGLLRLAMTSMSPPTNLMGGLRSLLLGRLGESAAAHGAARRTAVRAGWGFGVLAASYAVAVVVVPVPVGELAFGASWGDARGLAAVVAAGEVLRFAAIPATDLVRVFGRPATLVQTRLVTTAVSVTTTLGGGIVLGLDVVWAVAATTVVTSAIWWWRGLSVTPTVDPPLPDANGDDDGPDHTTPVGPRLAGSTVSDTPSAHTRDRR